MELKKRLPAVLLLVSVIPMMLIGFITLDIAERQAIGLAAQKLDSIASIQEARLEEVMDRNLERLRLVSSRTQLRISLERYAREGGEEDLLKMRRILVDAKGSIPDFEEVSVLGLDGTVVASSDPASEATSPLDARHREMALVGGFMDIVTDEQGTSRLRLAGPLVLENRTIGIAHITAGMTSIAAVVQDRTGLEGDGETLLAMRGPAGEALFITPIRSGAIPNSVPAQLTDLPIMQALAGTESTYTSKVNYAGLSVLAATRHVDATGWGLVVQIDVADVIQPVDDVRTKATIALFIFMMPLIAIALMTAHSISQPLVKLRTTLEDISMGNMETTIDPKLTGSRDEIGELARAFERMIVSLKLAMKLTAPELKRESDELRQVLREKEEAERALRESEERFKTLVHNVPGTVYRCRNDADWSMHFISDEVEELVGYPASDFIDNAERSFTSVIHPDDREMVDAAVQEGVGKKRPYIIEYRVIHKDGSVKWVYEKGQGIFGEDDRFLWLDGAVFDITERKEAERALRESESLLKATQEISHVGGWTFDVATSEVTWTEEVYRIHEMEPDPAIDHVAKSSKCYPPADRERVMAAFTRAIEEGVPYDLECRFISVKGRKMWVRTTARAEKKNGKVVRVIGNIMDITDRKQADE